ncbi:MAG: hypothetical protein LBF40_02995 [Deltaproteobacteria bacterium]|jgi:hypothetical protein|nr:hypothetical protein [Deltaproteobacteria bacterium]
MKSILDTVFDLLQQKFPNAVDVRYDEEIHSWVFWLPKPEGNYSVTLSGSMSPNVLTLAITTPYVAGKDMEMSLHHFLLPEFEGGIFSLGFAEETVGFMQQLLCDHSSPNPKSLN